MKRGTLRVVVRRVQTHIGEGVKLADRGRFRDSEEGASFPRMDVAVLRGGVPFYVLGEHLRSAWRRGGRA